MSGGSNYSFQYRLLFTVYCSLFAIRYSLFAIKKTHTNMGHRLFGCLSFKQGFRTFVTDTDKRGR